MSRNFLLTIFALLTSIVLINFFADLKSVSIENKNQPAAVPVSQQATSTQVNTETTTASEMTLIQATSTQATSTKKTSSINQKNNSIQSNKTIATTTLLTQTQTIAIPKTRNTIPFDKINDSTRTALVNIICTTKSAGAFSPASGSGVIISSDGIILTNAHIGQYYLLRDFDNQKDFVQCRIRTGSPAYPSYLAELIYISPLWVQENLKVLIEQNPKGTGEHDYAFLKIISKLDGSPITNSLPHMPISLDENLYKGENVLLASYPAGFLGGIIIERDLYQTSAITQIANALTFGAKTVDIISVPGTVISQKGSSGGAAVNEMGRLVGIITTSSEADTTGARDLQAITMPYINRDLMANAGTNLKMILENSQSISDTFNQTISGTLTKILTDSILGK